MKIQLGSITMNKTWKYLMPCLKAYGEEFTNKLNSVFKLATGIGDMVLVDSNIFYEQHVFILIDTNIGRKHFKTFLNWIKGHDSYEDDYAFDSVHNGHQHMVVIKLPEECYKPAAKFKKSQFSSMFTFEEVNKYFENKPEVTKILVKDQDYKFEFVKELNDMFDTDITPKEYEGELDFPIRKKTEYFNHKQKQ